MMIHWWSVQCELKADKGIFIFDFFCHLICSNYIESDKTSNEFAEISD